MGLSTADPLSATTQGDDEDDDDEEYEDKTLHLLNMSTPFAEILAVSHELITFLRLSDLSTQMLCSAEENTLDIGWRFPKQ